MMRYDPYTDSFIDNPTKETTATINLNMSLDNTIQRVVQVVEVSDESIEKIADTVVRKLQTERPCGNCQEWDCYGCDYKQTEREGE